MKKSILVLSMLVFLFSLNCFGQEKVVFGTFRIPIMVVDEQNGVFVELVQTIAKRANLDIEIIIYPAKRTLKYFLENRIDVMFPALDVNFQKNKTPIKSSELIYVKTDYCFTKKGNTLLKTIVDLKGKVVGITRGYPYVNELINNTGINLDYAPYDENNVKRLMLGYIDAFVVEEKSGLKAVMDTGFKDQVQYDKHVPLSKQDVYFAFQNNEQGKKLSKTISNIIREMKKDGTFTRIVKKAESLI